MQIEKVEWYAWQIAKHPEMTPPSCLEAACGLVREEFPELDDPESAHVAYCLYMAHGVVRAELARRRQGK